MTAAAAGHMLTVVIDDADLRGVRGGRRLLGRAPVTPLLGECQWAVMSADGPILALAIAVRAPVVVDFAMVFSAAEIRHHLAEFARGTTVGIAIRDTGPTDDQARLMGAVPSRRAPELAALSRSWA
ncbi:hypothetical protein SAMN05192558_101465 [Actinokineospora alba]|uniref:Uncharacterized protein n=1 Tax=Actinokineospora alba TaxID=504798 RepID=A0A1H0FQ80_9PSEU|nr:hypothetical protein [Actinokineospora alba]TDP69570.1 hypothetical protein C8E96_5161 [Actinokineospora alba]SDI13922.1 hypothetical protein SAMN05421871_103406 [Actinokineospora alba]SDN96826.1 hypothetical protein SAMN05192558_101465 [Actinokineospora alba]